jgi:Patatin-like phospholipase
MTKKVSITIAGAVSLGSYEAGVVYEVLDAIRQHNAWAAQNGVEDQRIEIDVLTGASAGGMTAAIVARYMLLQGNSLLDPYNNPMFNAWVKDIDIVGLLQRGKDEDLTHSILSSECVETISRRYLTPTPLGNPLPTPHPALPADGQIRLGLALSNLNGVDYARNTMSGGQFTYTRHADQYLISLDRSHGDDPIAWETIRATAVSCGAFPFAFSVQDLVRNITDFMESPYLVKSLWGGSHSTSFCYTDGGVFQNEPLGMAKNIVEELPNGHLNATRRGYLFIAPQPKASDVLAGFNKASANYKETIFHLIGAIMGQAQFQDWARAEDVNDRIALLNERAGELKQLFQAGTLTSAQTTPITSTLLPMFFQGAPADAAARLTAARVQLSRQYAQEYSSFPNPALAAAWLDAVLLLELAADLHEKEEMYIYDFIADPRLLAGGALYAFTGFFDFAYRKHDYDYGRSIAQSQIRYYMGQPNSLFAGLHWIPRSIDTINPAYNAVPLSKVDKSKRQQVYTQLMAAVDSLLSELGANWIERKGAETFLIRKYVKQALAL